MFTNISAEELSRQMREGSGGFLRSRRRIVGLSLFSAAILGGIGLYQTGILKKIPEPESSAFDGEKVHGSAEAYSHFDVPDALLGLISSAVTASLAGMGPQDRWKTHPWMPIAMGLKALCDAGLAGTLTVEQWKNYRAFSFWALVNAAVTACVLPLAFREVRAALGPARRQSQVIEDQRS